ncbi:two-component regulator propeller domain-containing protein [Chryseobacterium sp. JV274]|uniref:ligand-binding sensor domain-containing protein n=1 Tax=Chryseobacterium sp. JV274 TaxID=1932669 RepID=UPI0015C1FF4E|nr:two-component regulator propeller domain-containing protein [Chryseobacterium sp. JV274]CAD0219769.1 Two component regulator with propeller domain [Chryseobacterium sp. JV274]
MKHLHLYVLLIFVFYISCGQNQTKVSQENIKSGRANYSESQLKEAETSKVPMSMVRNVKQDRNGNILIASYFGVFRYDGTSFTNLTGKISSPCFSSFWDVLEDRKGNLWLGTKDSGVYYYNGESFRHFTTKDGLGSNSALHIYEDKAGNIWFGTGGGASRYDGKSFRNFTMKDGLPNNVINTFMEDKTGKLWIGTRGEACFYDGKTFTVFKNKEGKAFSNIWSIIEDKKGNIWFGDVHGLWRYDGSTFTNVSQRGAYAIIEDKKGNIWTTGEVNPQTWALSRYDAKSLYNKVPTLTEIKSGGRMAFLGILEANDGSIWLGSGSGVSRYDGKTVTDFKNKKGQK